MSDIIYINNKAIPRVDDNQKLFLNVLTILFGPSGTGKSSLITHILNTLRDVVPFGIVCCPTAITNGDYNNIIPQECIYDDLTANLMKKIFTRQMNVIAMYKMVRDIDSLKPIFEMVISPTARSKIDRLDSLLNNASRDIAKTYSSEDAESAMEELRGKYERKYVSIMRNTIQDNMKKLQKANLSELQRTILNNFNINPNILLIIDDCAASIKEWRDLEETKKLFFQGRHYYVTTILTMQNESVIPVPLRSNAHISIFTTQKITTTYFNKASSGASSEERKKIEKIAEVIFAPSDDAAKPNYKKLVMFSNIIKTDSRIQYIIASPKKKKFGSRPTWEMCSKMRRETPNVITKSSFTKMFNLKPVPQLE